MGIVLVLYLYFGHQFFRQTLWLYQEPHSTNTFEFHPLSGELLHILYQFWSKLLAFLQFFCFLDTKSSQMWLAQRQDINNPHSLRVVFQVPHLNAFESCADTI